MHRYLRSCIRYTLFSCCFTFFLPVVFLLHFCPSTLRNPSFSWLFGTQNCVAISSGSFYDFFLILSSIFLLPCGLCPSALHTSLSHLTYSVTFLSSYQLLSVLFSVSFTVYQFLLWPVFFFVLALSSLIYKFFLCFSFSFLSNAWMKCSSVLSRFVIWTVMALNCLLL